MSTSMHVEDTDPLGTVEIFDPLPLNVREPNCRRSRRSVAGKRFEIGSKYFK